MEPKRIRELLAINPHELGVEVIEHPLHTYDVGQWWVDARQAVSRAELRVDVTRSQVAKQIRQDPKAFGLKKDTDAAVKEAVEGHDSLHAARRDLADAYHTMNLAKVAYEQMQDKSIQLGRIKKLIDDGMYGEIRIRNYREPN